MITNWRSVILHPPTTNKQVLITDGIEWEKGRQLPSGRWIQQGKVEPIYWTDVPPLPQKPYTTPDGAVIVPLEADLWLNIADVLITGDELWSSKSSELCSTKTSYLTVKEIQNSVLLVEMTKNRNDVIVDWMWLYQKIWWLGQHMCYLRRKL